MTRVVAHALLLLTFGPLLACDREASAVEDAPAAAAPPVAEPMASDEAEASRTQPKEIYFDLTQFAWYREGRPLVHDGRSYLPQADPTPVDAELEEAGSYEGVTYYAPKDGAQPVYTLYVPVYYRYWQRFTSPPGT
ncbi:MAG TPA: hypothetical protein VF039_08650 [Longimicrobiales bacterium]